MKNTLRMNENLHSQTSIFTFHTREINDHTVSNTACDQDSKFGNNTVFVIRKGKTNTSKIIEKYVINILMLANASLFFLSYLLSALSPDRLGKFQIFILLELFIHILCSVVNMFFYI